jgi:hypothetical protein
MKKNIKEIIEMESRGEDLGGVLEGTGAMHLPLAGPHQRISDEEHAQSRPRTTPAAPRDKHIVRVNVDFTPEVLEALDAVVAKVGTNRQASIKEAVIDYVSRKVMSFKAQKEFLDERT